MWQAEIIKGGSFKDVQAMPLDIPFPKNPVFIFWPLVVWVLHADEKCESHEYVAFTASG